MASGAAIPPAVQSSGSGTAAPSSLLWREEEAELAELVRHVPEGGCIVEVGTAQGGSAAIMHAAARTGVRIYSVDIATSDRAREALHGTGITLITAPSAEMADSWSAEIGRPIDLLFVDGDHTFAGIHGDLAAWSRNMATGGTVACHDYDRPERGGVAHFAVRVCLDTVRRIEALADARHDWRLLVGRLDEPSAFRVPVAECFETLRSIAAGMIEARHRVFGGQADLTCVGAGLALIRERPEWLDSAQACHCVHSALTCGWDLLDQHSHCPPAFRRWAEALAVMDHGFGPLPVPEDFEHIAPPTTVDDLSRLIAREQLRLTLLSRVLGTLVDWPI